MIADILAVQNLYGISQVTAGDTTWGLGGTYGLQFAALFSSDPDIGRSPLRSMMRAATTT